MPAEGQEGQGGEMGPHHNVRNGRNQSCQTCINITKWLPVLFIVSVISWSYYAFVIQLCIFTMKELWLQIFTLVVYHIVLFLFLWAYWMTIFATTSRVPRKFKMAAGDYERIEAARTEEEVTQILDNIVRTQQLPVQNRTNVNQYRICEKCAIIKPDRCHHCSVCNQCVLKMDHHCPWVNACVCFDNYKFFILFLGYAFLYCLVIFSFSFKYFIDFWKNDWNGPAGGRFHVLFVFFVSAMFAVSLASLLGYHCFLVSRNRSTLESFRAPTFRNGPDKKAFNIGPYKNFVEVFGEDKWLWFFPLFTSLGDGVSFPTRHSLNLNGTYNSIDNTDSTTASSGNSPDQLIEIKVEARPETSSSRSPQNGHGHSSPSTNVNNGNGNGRGQGQRETPLVYF